MFNPTAAPVITSPLDDISSAGNAPDTVIGLTTHFDDPFTTGQVAQFELYDPSIGDDGITEVLLFDQAEAGAPLSAANFIEYVLDGAYANTIIHRSVPEFIIQGGGFTVDGFEDVTVPGDAVSDVTSNAPVQNEFSESRSNVRGTIAFAKLGNDPNSATNQWFFNLNDNSGNLDNQNGGFTVFGEVLSEVDLDGLDAIASLPTFNTAAFFQEGAFTDFPLILDDPEIAAITRDENFVRYQNISLVQRPELAFSIVQNTNPDIVAASIVDDSLVLDYVTGEFGEAEITVRAVNLVGAVIEDTFTVTTPENNNPNAEEDTATTDEDTPLSLTLAELIDNDDDIDVNDRLQIIAVDATSALGVAIVENDDGTLTYNPSASEILQALSAGEETVDSFTYSLTDDNGGSDIGTVSLTINGLNDAPTITSANSFSVVENLSAVGQVIATDADTETTLTFSLSGVDTSALRIDPDTGEINFNELVDFENPTDANRDNIFEVQAAVSDGNATVSQNLTIAVTDDNDNGALNTVSVKNNAQGQIDGLVYDTSAIALGEQLNVVLVDDAQVQSDAQFDNLIGLYVVADADGGIDVDNDGIVDFLTGDAGYAKAAIENRVQDFSIRAGASDMSTPKTTAESFGNLLINGGVLYAPFVIANGGGLGFDGFLAAEAAETDGVFNEAAALLEDAVAYFSFLGANPDRAEHIRAFGNNTFGFEDLPSNLGSSDNDFNDAVFNLEFRV